MIRTKGLALVLLGLLSACSKSPNPPPPEEPAKRSAEALANEWVFNPGKDHKLQGYGWFKTRSGENLVVASGRLQDTGKAREWMARVSAFYTEKCGSDKDPVMLHSQTGKHEVGINGEKNKGHYLIDEPGIMLLPIALIPPWPKELVFAYYDDNSTVTAVVWQQGNDVVLISVTATVR